MTIALIDADIIAMQAASMATRRDPFDSTKMIDLPFDDVKHMAQSEIDRINSRLNSRKFLLVFSPDSRRNFRTMVSSTYKNQRKPNDKPTHYWPLVRWMREEMPSLSLEGVEGDDLLGILHTRDLNSDSVVCSTDKDMKTVPGMLYNFKKDELTKIGIHEANYNWMFQTLVGDSVDNYLGCPGIGVKRAESILIPLIYADNDYQMFLKRQWYEVSRAFEKAYDDEGLGGAQAIRQARLARILRANDYNWESHEIRLWHPTEKVYMPVSQVK